jgi:hypothetical protein
MIKSERQPQKINHTKKMESLKVIRLKNINKYIDVKENVMPHKIHSPQGEESSVN